MNPRKPYNPRRRASAPTLRPVQRQQEGRSRWPLVAVPVLGVLLFMLFQSRTVLPSPKGTAPAIVTLTPQATPTAPEPAASATALPEPTLTPAPPPSASPTAIMTAISEATPTQLYTTQSGDTLPALAARFGVNPNDIVAPSGLKGSTTLEQGQLLVIPDVLSEVGPGEKLIPDSELVYSGGGAGFDPQQFAAEQGGYLAHYKGFADALTRNGGGVVLLVAQHQAINPRLLTALLEYQGGWITNPQPAGDALTYPLGYQHPYRRDLYHQLSWAAVQLATGYYGWRAGSLTELHFPDGSTLRLDPTLNAGTVALQYFFAQFLNRPEWDEAISTNGLRATYERLFGDPFSRAVDPLIPAELTQPELRLPFLPGHTWSFTGGPHGAWERGGAQAALDFAPGSVTNGCGESDEWVTAVAAGKVVRVDYGSVLLDLDGDGREATGWVILYLHVAAKDRVKEGAFVEAGARIGHPSCEGGQATGTHVHIARKYNGEWILADGVIPFDLEGWVAHQGEAEYKGTLTRGDQVIPACTCTAAWTGITAGQ